MHLKKDLLFLSIFILNLSILISLASAQSPPDVTKKNDEMVLIKRANIKSKSIIEYRFTSNGNETFSDSGYKSYFFSYDNKGKITGYIKYLVFSDLTVKEAYQYSGDNIIQTIRYNSAGDMIETIDYSYNSSGKLKREIRTAYYNSIRPSIHFTILANLNENGVFSKLQDELILEPKLESYTITVNISDPDELNQYVVIGDEMDPTSPRYSWSQLSISTQREILSYTGPNRKDHAYIKKNIAKVNYKYDKKGNLLRKSVYNTAEDLIEKETYTYNGDNQKLSHYKYNENGKISSMETYRWDAAGRLTESVGLDPAGNPESKMVNKYSEAGSLDERIWLSSTGEIRGRYKYTYDNENRMLEEIRFRDENEKESRTVYSYDTNGNILEIIKYDVNDTKEKLIKFVTEYWR